MLKNKNMKRVILILAFINLMLFAVISCRNSRAGISSSASAKSECYSGGPGTSTCEIPAGIDINGETTVGCSVTCSDGYYACCGLTCKCMPEA